MPRRLFPVYRDKRGRFISKEQYFHKGKKRYKSYKKGFVREQARVKLIPPKPLKPSKPKFKRYAIKKGEKRLFNKVQRKQERLRAKYYKKLEPLLTDFRYDDRERRRVREYSAMGIAVKAVYENALKEGHSTGEKRLLARRVYEARISTIREILDISRKETMAIARIVKDPNHPQYDYYRDLIYGGQRKV